MTVNVDDLTIKQGAGSGAAVLRDAHRGGSGRLLTNSCRTGPSSFAAAMLVCSSDISTISTGLPSI